MKTIKRLYLYSPNSKNEYIASSNTLDSLQYSHWRKYMVLVNINRIIIKNNFQLQVLILNDGILNNSLWTFSNGIVKCYDSF